MVEPLRHRQTKEAATDMFEPKATASHLEFTLNRMEVQLAAHTLEDGDQCSECSAVKLAGSE